MKYIFLILLSFLSAYSYSQVPDGWRPIGSRKVESKSDPKSKQEIMDWVAKKLIKYCSELQLDDIKEAEFEYPLFKIKTKDCYNSDCRAIEFTIDLRNLYNYEIDDLDGGHLLLKGSKIATMIVYHWSTSNEPPESYTIDTVQFYYVKWDMEDNLENRMKNALNDLIIILKKERKDKNEAY